MWTIDAVDYLIFAAGSLGLTWYVAQEIDENSSYKLSFTAHASRRNLN